MKILEKIVRATRSETKRDKTANPVSVLEKSSHFNRPVISLEESLCDPGRHGIIAEFKKRSPSRGTINSSAIPEEVCPVYFKAGASAVSVLTNSQFFGGSKDDLLRVRDLCNGPLLRKEFIIDEYQVIESRSIGADAILLIADILTAPQMKELSRLARSLALEVLFEIHDENGIEKLPPWARIVGVNSRNLDNFNVDPGIPGRTAGKLPPCCIKVAESGISSETDIVRLRSEGFSGFLIGERFMRETDPGTACSKFINNLKIAGS